MKILLTLLTCLFILPPNVVTGEMLEKTRKIIAYVDTQLAHGHKDRSGRRRDRSADIKRLKSLKPCNSCKSYIQLKRHHIFHMYKYHCGYKSSMSIHIRDDSNFRGYKSIS